MEDISELEEFDGFAKLRNALHDIAIERNDWSGIPMPLEDLPLVMEPTYPNAKIFSEYLGAEKKPELNVRNIFYSRRYRCDVVVYEKDGKATYGIHARNNRLDIELSTLGAADAWGIKQESAALSTLAEMVRHRQFRQYLLTGMFLERSRRSGVSYLFRKLKPTIAIRASEKGVKPLCALCLHPIGYYEGSWAGAMCPTDDIIAHLTLMRGDEKMFWRRANQHPLHVREAGV